jgi:hypothetical protein
LPAASSLLPPPFYTHHCAPLLHPFYEYTLNALYAAPLLQASRGAPPANSTAARRLEPVTAVAAVREAAPRPPETLGKLPVVSSHVLHHYPSNEIRPLLFHCIQQVPSSLPIVF